MIQISDYIRERRIIGQIVEKIIQMSIFIIRRFVKRKYIPGNVVVISLFNIGDTVFTIPAIKSLQYFYKKITVVCFPESIPIYKEGLSNVEYHPLSHSNFYFNKRIAKIIARKEIKFLKPEIIIDLNGVLTSVSLILFCGSRINISMARTMFKTLYNHFIQLENNSHLIERYYKIVAQIIPKEYQNFSKEFNTSCTSETLILIHPFAGWKAKEWNLRKYIQLAVKLSSLYEVLIISDCNSIADDIVQEIKSFNIKLVQTKSIEDLVKVIKKCSAFIGNDSGPIHIADLLGKPTFCIYGPTNPIYPEPIGEHHSKFISNVKCTPKGDEELCFTFGGRKGCPSHECMNQISIESIYIEVKSFLKKNLG